jgi:hypothetical protein
MTVELHIGSTQVGRRLVLFFSDLLGEIAFEFSKRRFARIYRDQLPIWALFVSGASGGVCSLEFYYHIHQPQYQLQIAYWLSCYPLGNFRPTDLWLSFYKLIEICFLRRH